MQTKSLQMKRALRTALLVLLLGAVGMGKGYADWNDGFDFSEVCSSGQTLYYKISGNNVKVVCPGDFLSGNPYGSYVKPTGNIVVPSTVTHNGTTYSVISINDYAFYGCGYIISVDIPNSVVSIGQLAFFDCISLASIAIPSSVTSIGGAAFADCGGLTSIIIPNSVTSIGNAAFEGCYSLTSMVIPDSVTIIEGNLFRNCVNLASVVIPSSVTHIGRTYLYQDYPGHYTTVWAGSAFEGCSSLTSIDIPNSVTYIGNGTFSYCSQLTSITIPISVDTIGEEAFKNCTRLAEVKFNARNCVYFGNSVFANCTSLELEVGSQVQNIPNKAFKGCTGLSSVIMSNSVTRIGSSAFASCSGLTSIVIPKSVTSIGGAAFEGCSRLTTVYYNAQNATGGYAFSNCSNLTTIHIGSDVQEINSSMFSDCTDVHLVVALGPTPATLVGNAFADFANNSILMVSCGKRLTYYSVWNMFDFNNIIEDCGEYAISMNNVGAGGNVTASPSQAQMGQTVTLTVTPNPGMALSSISVANAIDPTQTIPVVPTGKATSKFNFVMPPYGVSVTATFTAGNAVSELNNVEVSVYPNPTNGQVKIEAEGLKHITISNTLGQVIYEGKASGDMFEYDFGKHGAGLYLIGIETATGLAVKKVSVVR